MLQKALTKVFGSKNDRELKRLQPLVDKINALEETVAVLDDDARVVTLEHAATEPWTERFWAELF